MHDNARSPIPEAFSRRPATGGHASRRVTTAVLAAALIGAALAAAPAAQAAPAADADATTQLVLSRVGTPDSELVDGPSAVSLVTMNGAGGVADDTVDLPTTATAPQTPFTLSGTSDSQGALRLSTDGRYLTMAGFDTVPDASGDDPKDLTAAAAPRSVARIAADGTVDTSTLLTGAYTTDNPRIALSTDGTTIYTAGNGKSNTGTAAGVSLTTLGSTAAPTGISKGTTNLRSLALVDGNLYASSDKTSPIGIVQIGTGTPTAATTSLTPVVTLAGTPLGFTLLDTDGDGTPDVGYAIEEEDALVKVARASDGTWSVVGSRTGTFQDLTAVQDGTEVDLYVIAGSDEANTVERLTDSASATAAPAFTETDLGTAPAGTAYRGIAFAPTDWSIEATGSVSAHPTVTSADASLPLDIGDASGAATALTLTSANDTAAGDLDVTVASSNPTVLPASDIVVTGSGATRTLTVTPGDTVGESTVTVTATDPATGNTGTTTVKVGVSGDTTDLPGSRYLTGASNASSTVDVGDGYAVVADDETNTLRLYDTNSTGPALKTWNFDEEAGSSGEGDLEAGAQHDGVVTWVGSLSNNKSGEADAERDLMFSTKVTGSGADTDLTYTGTAFHGLKSALLAWDETNGNALGLRTACADGVLPDIEGGCNVEGFEWAPDGTTGLLGFRAPLVDGKALVVPVTNLSSVLAGDSTTPAFGDAILLDLGGRTIREIRRTAAGQYLITAGAPDDTADAGLGWALYRWGGTASSTPEKIMDLPGTTGVTGQEVGSWESIVSASDLNAGGNVTLATDNGTTDFYGTGDAAKDIELGLQKDRVTTLTLPATADPDAVVTPTPTPTPTPTATPSATPASHLAATSHSVISGTAKRGKTLHASAASWNTSGASITYRWLRDGDPIAGATSRTYTVKAADAGTHLRIRATATKVGWTSATATSAAVHVAKLDPTLTATIAKKHLKAGVRAHVSLRLTVPGATRIHATLVVRRDGHVVRHVTVTGRGASATEKVALATGGRGTHVYAVAYAGDDRSTAEHTSVRVRVTRR